MSEKCCCFERCCLFGKCDTQHKCVSCKRYIHAICGEVYYGSDGEVVESLAYPRKCFECAEKAEATSESLSELHTVSQSQIDTEKGTTSAPASTSQEPRTTVVKEAPSRLELLKQSTAKSFFSSDEEEEDAADHDGKDDQLESESEMEDGPPMPPLISRQNRSEELKSLIELEEENTISDNDNNDDDSEGDDSNGGEKKDNDDESSEYEELFTEEERKKHYPGFFLVRDLKRNQTAADFYKGTIDPTLGPKTRLVNKIVHVPASYWGIDLLKKKWWKDKRYNEKLRRMTYDQMRRQVVTVGKIIQKSTTDKNCYEVAFFANSSNDEISLISAREIRNFVHLESYEDQMKRHKNEQAKKAKMKASSSSNSSTPPKKKQRKSTKLSGNVQQEEEKEEEDFIEIDDFESEEDLFSSDEEEEQEEDETETATPTNNVDPDLWTKKDPKLKVDRIWSVVPDVTSTTYIRPVTPSYVNNVPNNDWNTITPYNLFMKQLPAGEIELWCSLTSDELHKQKKQRTSLPEMKAFLGCMFAFTQSSKVGGIRKAFEEETDGLFRPQDLGRFGLKYRRFSDILSCWTFAKLDNGVEEADADPYWRTDQLIDRFNAHYATNFTHGTYVNVDERIFWSFARAQPEGVKVCGRKPRGTGQECKTLSSVDVNCTTTFEQIRGNKEVSEGREFVKEYGKAASVVVRLCKKAGIEGSNRIVIADSWFANLALLRGLRSIGLHLIGMIKQGDGGFPKKGLCALLDEPGKEARGSHAVATTKIDGEPVIGLAWKGKSDRGRKGKKKKFWMSTFIASDCTTTIAGTPAEKKRHTKDGQLAPSVFVPRPKLVEDYYNAMPGTDIVNRNAQFLIGMEDAVRTSDISKRMACTILSTWMANSYGMAKKFFPLERRKKLTTASFTREVILGGLFEPLAGGGTPVQVQQQNNNARPNQRTEPETLGAVVVGGGQRRDTLPCTIDSSAIDPYVHTMQKFKDVDGVGRQQRCVTCNAEGRMKTQTSVYCGLCTITANKETDRKPTRHAYCLDANFQCFSRHIAACYMHMKKTGTIAQRAELRHNKAGGSMANGIAQANIPIAGRVILSGVPKRRKSKRTPPRTRTVNRKSI